MANWADEAVDCRLEIDFAVLGINPKRARLHAVAIEGFQSERTFHLDEGIPIASGQAWLLLLEAETATTPAQQ